jgi:hypothetical protein
MPDRKTGIVGAVIGFLLGFALGVPTGAQATQISMAVVLGPGSIAENVCLQFFVVLSLLLFLPHFTRKAGWFMIIITLAYMFGVLAGHGVGYQLDNFIGWHPD